jgi:hypothetical protein
MVAFPLLAPRQCYELEVAAQFADRVEMGVSPLALYCLWCRPPTRGYSSGLVLTIR